MIKNHDELIEEFVSRAGMVKLVRELEGDEIKYYEREKFPRKAPVDVWAEDINGKTFAFELYYTLPSVSNILQKIKA